MHRRFYCECTVRWSKSYAASADYLVQKHNFAFLVWLGKARLGVGRFDDSWDALERLRAGLAGVPFQTTCPLQSSRAECALARKDVAQAREIAESLVEIATAHHDVYYQAHGWRVLAEIAMETNRPNDALECVRKAGDALQRCEAWNLQWRIDALESRILAALGRGEESAAARDRGLLIANRVAATLNEEPELRRSLLARAATEFPAGTAATG